MLPISRNSPTPKPRVVPAGEPTRMPLAVVGPIFGAIAGAAYAYRKGTKNKAF